jgi:hypothetical protein
VDRMNSSMQHQLSGYLGTGAECQDRNVGSVGRYETRLVQGGQKIMRIAYENTNQPGLMHSHQDSS